MTGRPTKYNKDMLTKAQWYLANHEDCGDAVPTPAGLAGHLGVSKSTVYAWGREHDEFSHTLEQIQSRQERLLVSGGLTGAYQPTIAKLMLANHGYSDKAEHQVTGAGGGPIEQSIQIVWGADDED